MPRLFSIRSIPSIAPVAAIAAGSFLASGASAAQVFIGLQSKGGSPSTNILGQDTSLPGKANAVGIPEGSTADFGVLLATDGNTMYYVNHDTGDGRNFYSSNFTGTNPTLIGNDTASTTVAYSLAAGNGTVYIGSAAQGSGIATLSETGSSSQTPVSLGVTGLGQVTGLAYDGTNNFLFEVDNTNLRAIALSDKHVTTVASSVNLLNGNGQTIAVDTVDHLIFYSDATTAIREMSYTVNGDSVTFGSPSLVASASSISGGVSNFRGMGYDYTNNQLLIGDSGKSQVYVVANANGLTGTPAISIFDSGLSSGDYGGLTVASSPTPEPASLSLAMVGFCGLLARRRRRA